MESWNPNVEDMGVGKRQLIGVARRARGWLAAALAAVIATGLVIYGPAAARDLTQTFKPFDGASTIRVDHAAFDRLLGQFVHVGKGGLTRVDYAALKRDGREALEGYIASLEAVDPARLNRAEQFAYWTNLYNAVTLETVVAHYPVAGIRDIDISGGFSDGPWGKKLVKVKGTALSLDDIEHKILRPNWNYDPRIHYVVNCASLGCPNLARTAYRGEGLEAALEAAARAYVNSPRGVTVANGMLTASSLYSWYRKDFGANRVEVLDHIRRYAEPALRAQLEGINYITQFAYDWALNDSAAAAGQ